MNDEDLLRDPVAFYWNIQIEFWKRETADCIRQVKRAEKRRNWIAAICAAWFEAWMCAAFYQLHYGHAAFLLASTIFWPCLHWWVHAKTIKIWRSLKMSAARGRLFSEKALAEHLAERGF